MKNQVNMSDADLVCKLSLTHTHIHTHFIPISPFIPRSTNLNLSADLVTTAFIGLVNMVMFNM